MVRATFASGGGSRGMREANVLDGGRGPWATIALALAVPVGVLGAGRLRRRQHQEPANAERPRAAAPAPDRVVAVRAPRGRRRRSAGRGGAPVDMTGYWVSIVTEDWIERMSPDSPPSGVAERRSGRIWRRSRWRTGGGARRRSGDHPDPCRVYGAGGSMRVPGRLHITWADDNTLKVEMDAGTQTRLFRFNAAAGSRPRERCRDIRSHRGNRSAVAAAVASAAVVGAAAAAAHRQPRAGAPEGGHHEYDRRLSPLEPQHLQRECGPHRDTSPATPTSASSTSPSRRCIDDGGQNRITSSTFKKEADGSKFSPSGCEIVK